MTKYEVVYEHWDSTIDRKDGYGAMVAFIPNSRCICSQIIDVINEESYYSEIIEVINSSSKGLNHIMNIRKLNDNSSSFMSIEDDVLRKFQSKLSSMNLF